MRENKKQKLYCTFDATLNGKMPDGSGFGNRLSSGDGITRRHSLCLACFLGSDLDEQLWFKSIEVNNRQRQKDWGRIDEKSIQEHSKLYKQLISRNTFRSQKIKISPLLSLIHRLLI